MLEQILFSYCIFLKRCSVNILLGLQMGQDIYYTVMKDIQAGEQLKVWYAPYYAVKMGAVPFNIDFTADVST
jgi:hypothetical protein